MTAIHERASVRRCKTTAHTLQRQFNAVELFNDAEHYATLAARAFASHDTVSARVFYSAALAHTCERTYPNEHASYTLLLQQVSAALPQR